MKEDPRIRFFKALSKNAIPKPFQDRIFFLGIFLLILGCSQDKDLVNQKEYEGPLSSLDSINTLLSDSARIIMHMEAPRQNNFENGDQEWPNGLFLESYDKNGEVTTIFKANYVFYNGEENLYRAEGNVIVRSNESGDELNTEELYWDPTAEKFYTEKFVTINTDGEVHTGEGMEAKQDFSSYRILKPRGTFTLEDDPGTPNQRTIPLEKNETP